MSCSAVISGIDGASRMSSVFGLKVRPSTRDGLAAQARRRSAAITLRAMARLRLSLTAATVSTMRSGAS